MEKYFEETEKFYMKELAWITDSEQSRNELLLLMLIAQIKELNDSVLSLEETIRFKE